MVPSVIAPAIEGLTNGLGTKRIESRQSYRSRGGTAMARPTSFRRGHDDGRTPLVKVMLVGALGRWWRFASLRCQAIIDTSGCDIQASGEPLSNQPESPVLLELLPMHTTEEAAVASSERWPFIVSDVWVQDESPFGSRQARCLIVR